MSLRPTTAATLSADDNYSLEVAKAVTDYAPINGFQIHHDDRCPHGSPNVPCRVADAETGSSRILVPARLPEATAVR
jgi:hypothetical protein